LTYSKVHAFGNYDFGNNGCVCVAQAHAAITSDILGHKELRLLMPTSITLARPGRLQCLRVQLAFLD